MAKPGANGRPTQTRYLAIMVKAWNAYVEDRTVQNLVWRRNGVNREIFPALKDLQGATWEPRNEF